MADLVQSLFDKIFADRGDVSQPLATKLLENFGIQFIEEFISACCMQHKPPGRYTS